MLRAPGRHGKSRSRQRAPAGARQPHLPSRHAPARRRPASAQARCEARPRARPTPTSPLQRDPTERVARGTTVRTQEVSPLRTMPDAPWSRPLVTPTSTPAGSARWSSATPGTATMRRPPSAAREPAGARAQGRERAEAREPAAGTGQAARLRAARAAAHEEAEATVRAAPRVPAEGGEHSATEAVRVGRRSGPRRPGCRGGRRESHALRRRTDQALRSHRPRQRLHRGERAAARDASARP